MTSRGLDLAAVSADDRVLDLLAARAPAGGGDRAVALLLTFAGSVDDGLVQVLHEPFVAPGSAQGLTAVTDAADSRPRWVGRSRRLGRPGGAVAVLVVAVISVSGTAAAVTGNPYTAYEKVKDLVVTVTGRDDAPRRPGPGPGDRLGPRGSGSPGRVTSGGGASGRTADVSAGPGSGRTPSSTPSAPATAVPAPTALPPAALPTPAVSSEPERSGRATETPEGSKARGPKEPKESDPAKRTEKAKEAAAPTAGRRKKTGESPNTAEKPSQKPGEKPGQQSAEKPAGNPGQKSAEKPTGNPGQKSAEKPAENPGQKPAEKPGQKSAKATERAKPVTTTIPQATGTPPPAGGATEKPAGGGATEKPAKADAERR